MLLLLMACSHLQGSGSPDELDHTLDLYWKAFRWQDPVAGSSFVLPSARGTWLRRRDAEAKDLTVTSFEVQGERVDPDGQTARTYIKVTWFKLPSTVEQSDLVEQRWIYDRGNWQVTAEKGRTAALALISFAAIRSRSRSELEALQTDHQVIDGPDAEQLGGGHQPPSQRALSSGEGEGSPEGWLCAKRIAAAPSRRAGDSASRVGPRKAQPVPSATVNSRSTRKRTSSSVTLKTSTGRWAMRGLKNS